MANAQVIEPVMERLLQLPSCLSNHNDFVPAVDSLRQGKTATFDGVWGSSRALVVSALASEASIQPTQTPLVLVCPNDNDADDLFDDLELFTNLKAERFPAWESSPGERIVQDETCGQRLRLLKQLAASRKDLPPIIVASIQGLLQPVPSLETVEKSTVRIEVGGTIEMEQLSRWLVEAGCHNTSAVELPGEFSLRGGIIDIFAPDWQSPVRVELFDNEVESIRRFEITSQRSVETLNAIDITMLSPNRSDKEHFGRFLPPQSWIVLVEPSEAEEAGKQYLSRLEDPDLCHSIHAVFRELGRFALANVANLSVGASEHACNFQIESVERFSGQVGEVKSELERVGHGHDVYLVVQTDAEIERLKELLEGTRIATSGRLHFVVGCLHHGFRLVDQRIVVVSGSEVFHRADLRRLPRRRLGKAIDSFLDLREGDLVVHLAHGIGRYRGLKLLSKDEQVEEHLEIEFHGRSKIYVPSTRIDLVQKYVGGSKTRPTLARVGGKTWLRQKQAAEQAVTDLASDMLQLQAARRSRPGIAFGKDTEWQHEFVASFPYQETGDQDRAWDAIRYDMQQPRPMDRLMCGDVGFGKTEIAMRAAFKAIESGYQVAVLVPTTVLAEQHYHTFSERMAEFPFDIAKLSRFCSTAEQRVAIEGLALGSIDLVIGTHRLASKDVEFYNLGLVVIDEEQRFGVEVKERLKSLRSTVDVLTMTATPIPRTLHMSLVGVRDISNLETPPEDRLAVETRVTRFDDQMIRHAVMRELNRGGQIFFVHNRINDIHVVEQKLRRIAPEATIRIGHGQMPERELESVMVDFVAGKFDILLATTIVESGLDIPNANTIFIDEADRYGLAELHQLRGRVGRYKHRAYCYLLIDPRKHVTPTASKRLRAIEEYSELGAGFSLAMRDLEIRGAGNLLGTQQSGHIAAVGYEFYCQLLENAVRQLKSMPPKLSIEVDIDLPGEAYLPDDFVPDMRLKIDLYRRMSRVETFDQIGEMKDELVDRFGTPPAPAARMLALAELRLHAAFWQINSIHVENQYLVFSYQHKGRIEQLAELCKGKLRVVDDKSAYVTMTKGVVDPVQVLADTKSVLCQL